MTAEREAALTRELPLEELGPLTDSGRPNRSH